jgi:hypothetical protein
MRIKNAKIASEPTNFWSSKKGMKISKQMKTQKRKRKETKGDRGKKRKGRESWSG